MFFSEDVLSCMHLFLSFMESNQFPQKEYSCFLELFSDLFRLQDSDGKTLLHHLCSNRPTATSKSLIRLLLHFGTSANIQDVEGLTPLNTLLLWCQDPPLRHEIAEVLLQYGAIPNMYPSNHMSPLITAVVLNDRDLLSLLLDHGADPNARFYTLSPLHVPNMSSALSLSANKSQWSLFFRLLQCKDLSESVQFHALLRADPETKLLFRAYLRGEV
jgi:ankyrin repeat protein